MESKKLDNMFRPSGSSRAPEPATCRDASPPCANPEHRERREAAVTYQWSALTSTDRDYPNDFVLCVLDGRLVRDGDQLILQEVEATEGELDGCGLYFVYQPDGGVLVSLESTDEQIRVVVEAGGTYFFAPLEPWMRFRWPDSTVDDALDAHVSN